MVWAGVSVEENLSNQLIADGWWFFLNVSIIIITSPLNMIAECLISLFQVMRQLQLLPLTSDAVEHKVGAFRHYTDEVTHCILQSDGPPWPKGLGNVLGV